MLVHLKKLRMVKKCIFLVIYFKKRSTSGIFITFLICYLICYMKYLLFKF